MINRITTNAGTRGIVLFHIVEDGYQRCLRADESRKVLCRHTWVNLRSLTGYRRHSIPRIARGNRPCPQPRYSLDTRHSDDRGTQLKTTIRTIAGRCAFSADELTGESTLMNRRRLYVPRSASHTPGSMNRIGYLRRRVELSELTQPADVHFQFETLMFLASSTARSRSCSGCARSRHSIAVHREQMFRAITGNCHSNWPPQYMWILAQGHQPTPI